MRVINVIVVKDNMLDSIESFGVIDEQDSQTVIDQAEECFTETIVALKYEDVKTEAADNLRNEIEENWLDEGYYDINPNTIVYLSWSDINNVQF